MVLLCVVALPVSFDPGAKHEDEDSFRTVFFLMAVSMGFIPAAHATPENKEIIVGFNNVAWPPYLLKETNGKIHGIMIDVMKEIASKHGFSVKITPLPEKRAIRGIAGGDIDAYSKAKEWVENPEAYLWTDPVVDSTDVLIFPKDRPVDLRRRTISRGKKSERFWGTGTRFWNLISQTAA
jgi:ABC-type amino acid transport substrate-binding protein